MLEQLRLIIPIFLLCQLQAPPRHPAGPWAGTGALNLDLLAQGPILLPQPFCLPQSPSQTSPREHSPGQSHQARGQRVILVKLLASESLLTFQLQPPPLLHWPVQTVLVSVLVHISKMEVVQSDDVTSWR